MCTEIENTPLPEHIMKHIEELKIDNKHLEELRIKNSDGKDRAILTLSAGALALSLAFCNAFKENERVLVYALVVAWIAFALSLISILFSFIFGEQATDEQICTNLKKEEALEKRIDPKDYHEYRMCEKLFNRYRRFTHYCNVTSCLSFVVGVISFIIFAIFNI